MIARPAEAGSHETGCMNDRARSALLAVFVGSALVVLGARALADLKVGATSEEVGATSEYRAYVASEAADAISLVRFGPHGLAVDHTLPTGLMPNDIDDPTTPSGGNRYDRRLSRGLTALGWSVSEHIARGAWPQPSAAERAAVGRLLGWLPDGSVVEDLPVAYQLSLTLDAAEYLHHSGARR